MRYSKYNPYEPKSDKKRRIWSNISICVIIALFIFGIYLIMTPTDYGMKYYFETTTTEKVDFSQTLPKNNEFYDVYNAMLDPENHFEMDNGFSDEFPTIAKLFNMDPSVYKENQPYIHESENHIAVAQSFYSTNENRKTLDIAVFGFDKEFDDTTASIEMNEFIRFTLIYNTSQGNINYMGYDKSMFRMQLNNFTLSLGCGTMKNVGYELTLKSTKGYGEAVRRHIFNTVVDAVNNSVHKPDVEETDEKTVITLNQAATDFPKNTAEYRFDLTGEIPTIFKSFVVSMEIADGTMESDIQYSFKVT